MESANHRLLTICQIRRARTATVIVMTTTRTAAWPLSTLHRLARKLPPAHPSARQI